ncbi:hypothetical protein A2U01_0083547, partial [Trifolium medium]|nr:hypothetical protein [Trifolium medium]
MTRGHPLPLLFNSRAGSKETEHHGFKTELAANTTTTTIFNQKSKAYIQFYSKFRTGHESMLRFHSG